MERSARVALLALVPLAILLVGGPAQAHGALTTPPSRAYECGPLGGAAAKSAACQAADAASGGAASLSDWDNLRVPNVNGRDRQLIPDGKLCSGGLPSFRGLDLARADWPTTKLTPGAAFTFEYKTTIPHEGSFRLYVTKDGYDPTRPLRWADLEPTPFLTVTQPKPQNGAYPLRGTLPNKSGRQLIYTIWQTTSTVDTYYSCTDVVFGAGGGAAAGKPSSVAPPPSAPASPSTSPAAALAERADGTPVPVASTSHSGTLLPAALGTAGALAAIGVAIAFFLRRRTT